jgi:hypothetical protein
MNEISQVLSSIGFIDPVTKETSGKDFYHKLGLQMNEYFIDYFKRSNDKLITLIDAYCIYNRARGISNIMINNK